MHTSIYILHIICDIFSLAFISLVCFNQFKQPRKKLDGALPIPFNLDEISNFGNIEEEILSRPRPKL